jgi:hypothetical protein
VAVGAEQLEVRQAVVVPIAVHVVERERQRLTEPIDDAAAGLLQSCGEESSLDHRAVAPPAEQLLD